MAKSRRRNKSKNTSPNLPKEVLDRARRQLEGEDANGDEDADSDEIEETETTDVTDVEEAPARTPTKTPVAASTTIDRTKRRAERKSSRQKSGVPELKQFSQRDRRKRDVLDAETIERMLAHPTKIVTEEELHAEYGFVLADLRNMGILAAALMILLMVLAQFI